MIKLLLFLNLFLLEPVVIDIKVRGMVCSFCAQGIEKNISKLKMVENVDVNLKRGFVSIMVKDGESIDMNEIEQIIKDAGYKVLK
jgi:copper chaperone CopZ